MTKGPSYISHVGLRARNYAEMLEWYGEVMGAEVQHRNDFLAFLSFDDEHHRMVIYTQPDTVERPATANGVDHIGYGVRDHAHLVEIYERLRDKGIKPSSQLNHRFTTSLYYHDPDGNEVEFSVDNLPTKAECTAFVQSDAMNEISHPPFGHDFDPEALAKLVHTGAPASELARVGLPD
jgi:catechol-2,3-dioxygenase